MTNRFAATTSVTEDQSRRDIERLLMAKGAASFVYGWESPLCALIAFRMLDRDVKMIIPMPDPDGSHLVATRSGKIRTADQIENMVAQERRQRWRAVLLVLKARFEAIELGISTFEREFLADILLPNGKPIGEAVIPGAINWIDNGRPTALLPGPRCN